MKIENIFTCIGLILFVIGGSGLDSEQMLLPVVMCIAGLLLLYVTTKESRPTFGKRANGKCKELQTR